MIARFSTTWQALNNLVIRVKGKTATISDEEERRFAQLRNSALRQYTLLKQTVGGEIDPDRRVAEVLSRVSSLQDIREMSDAERNTLLYRFGTVQNRLNAFAKMLEKPQRSVSAATEAAARVADAKAPRKKRMRGPTFWTSWIGAMFDPAGFFAGIPEHGGIFVPVRFLFKLVFLVFVLLIAGLMLFFRQTTINIDLSRFFPMTTSNALYLAWHIATFLIFYLVFASLYTVVLLVTSGVSCAIFRIFGGKGSYEESFKLTAFSSAPLFFIPFYLIYLPLVVVPFLYQFVIRVIGGSKIHKISLARALLSRLVFLLPLIIALVLLWFGDNYRDLWHPKAGESGAYLVHAGGAGSIPIPPQASLDVMGHREGCVLVSYKARGNTFWGYIDERNLVFREVDFGEFMLVEIRNLPLRVYDFVLSLNIRFRERPSAG